MLPLICRASILLIGVFAGSALAEEPKKPPAPPPDGISIFMQQNPDCREFSDSCSVCRVEKGNVPNCSTVGIACVKTEWRCTSR